MTLIHAQLKLDLDLIEQVRASPDTPLMCSRYTSPEEKELARIYDLKVNLEDVKPVIYPGYSAPIIREDSGLVAEVRFWGFVTRFPGKRDPKTLIEKIMQNAVSETVDEKRTFKGAWDKSQRCIIPVKNFMEPKGGKFVPIVGEEELLTIAGIWGITTPKGKERQAFTMLTCEPNKFMSDFHDRMPVILDGKDADEWLSPDTPPDQAKKLCRPFQGKLKFA